MSDTQASNPPSPAADSSSPQSAYGYHAMRELDPHRRPVRVTVVAILCFAYGGSSLFTPILGMAAQKMAMDNGALSLAPLRLFGVETNFAGMLMASVVILVLCLLSGILLLKRKELGVWLLLATCALTAAKLGFDAVFLDEAMKASFEGLPQQTSMEVTIVRQGAYASAITGFVMNYAAMITVCWLTFSVLRWFRGKAIFPVSPLEEAKP